MTSSKAFSSEAPAAISSVEALHYRSLRYVSQPLKPFHVLVGPNASGKSTFLDVVAMLGDIVRVDLETAVQGDTRLGIPLRARDARHLTWMRKPGRFELAMEVQVPPERQSRIRNGSTCRYEIAVETRKVLRIVTENLWLKGLPELVAESVASQRTLFPEPPQAPNTIVHAPYSRSPAGWKKVLSRGEEPEKVMFRSETSGWTSPFRLSAGKAALASLPEDEEKFPVATWLRTLLSEGVQRVALSSEEMRRPSPPGQSRRFLPDGSNLPHVVHILEEEHPKQLLRWLAHVQEALPDLEHITTRELPDDRHRYLVLRYRSGLEAPSWLVSDGTLRLLALTLLAYLPDLSGLYLVEEPENGIHPRAVEIAYQSLSSVYNAQVLLATHSPVVVGLASPDQVLCFARDEGGATDIVAGTNHPRLRDWQGSIDLGTLLAAGVLG